MNMHLINTLLWMKRISCVAKAHEPRSIRIISFVQNDEIDSVLYDRSYFIGPTPGHEKSYLLLKEALERTNKLGLIHIAIRKTTFSYYP